MPDDAITRLNAALEGRYAIERELGEGGMSTVYLADDLKHQRKVALKVLKPELAAVVGAERFLAEIKTTANLTHPHILPLFDSGEADSFLFYVMPHIEGESLRERIDREKQLPVDEAVKIATDLAEALDYAHRHKIIHRDIKPSNILLQDGKPVISDFGIALAVGVAGGGRLTETGLSVGTPHYMSPEQATGDQAVGVATDIYALGAVLYEMLVGEPPYTGSTAQAILGKIIQGKTASATEERASVPANVDAAIRKALEKLPADRFTGARDFAKALADPGFRHGTVAGAGASAGRGPWKRLAIAASAVAVILAAVVLSEPDARASPVVRFTVPVGEGTEVYLGGERDAFWGRPSSTSLAISPDGDLLVYSAWEVRDGNVESRLYLRRLDQERADPIEGTEGGSSPFFSPDGAWIGFYGGTSLRRVAVAEGNVETIVQEADVPNSGLRGATWGDDGTIVYGGTDGLYRVSAGGGDPELLAEADTVPPGFIRYAQPHMLPGGEVLLFHGMRSMDPEQTEILALDLATGAIQMTGLTNAMDPRYVETGHLLFMRQGTLMAVGFDLERVEVEGQPATMLEDVMQAVFMPNTDWETGAAQLAVSPSGHVAYARGGVYPEDSMVVMRVTVNGEAEPIPDMDPRRYLHLRVSPEGDRLAFVAGPGGAVSIYVLDLVRGVTQSLNTGGYSSFPAMWSPDGLSIAFSSDREDGVKNVYRMAVDGSGEPERLAPSEQSQRVSAWSSEGVIAYLQGGDIWMLPPDGEPAPFFTSDASERWASFSPDGRWLAYTSDQAGRDDVYVRPYPGPGSATLISGDGGVSPAWSHDGRQLYFLQLREAAPLVMMVADVVSWGRVPCRPCSAAHRSLALRNGHPSEGLRCARGRLIRRDQGCGRAGRRGGGVNNQAADAPQGRRVPLGPELLREFEGADGQLTRQIPWLRVFVEGVVIVGKLEEAASTGGSSRSDREYSDSLRP